MTEFRRIAVEEAFNIPEIAERLAILGSSNWPSTDISLLKRVYVDTDRPFLKKLLALGEARLEEMDANGVDVHLLSLTCPGVQMFDADTAVALAALSNDRLAEAIAANPGRFAGLAAFAPQDPARAVREMERAVEVLGLNGFLVNSHTNGEYLDEPKFWPILEAAEALERPLYIHPRGPSEAMAGPFRTGYENFESGAWGYGIETGTHAVRLLLGGIFERFPRLKVVLGHMGEGIPFWLWRLDYMSGPHRNPNLKLKPSDYFRRNVAITTSGMESHPALHYALEVLGEDNIMWAIDHPYQPTAPAVAFMNEAPVADAVKAKLFAGNAERIFHLG